VNFALVPFSKPHEAGFYVAGAISHGGLAMIHKGVLAATMLVLAAATSTSAWAAWGCAYGSDATPGISGRRWGADTEKAARDSAMNYCISNHLGNCHIIGCSDNVNSKEDADKLWKPSVKLVPCGGKGQNKC